jgi:hypothetical protein
MDISFLSLVDLIRNACLAIFAICTWYIAHEERRARLLFNLSLTDDSASVRNLAETIIELRDKKGIREKLKGRIESTDFKRLERKIDRLRNLDYARNSSVIMFSLFVLIEIAMFVYYSLLASLN